MESKPTSAAALLDLDWATANSLFYPLHVLEDHGVRWASITNAEAVMVLDHLLATGKVDWMLVHKARKAAARKLVSA